MSITADRVVNSLIKNLKRKERQHYSKAQFIAYLDAAAFVLIKIHKERHREMTYSIRDKILNDEAHHAAEFQLFLKQRDEACMTLDMDFARRLMPGASSDEVRLLALHKARYEMTKIPAELRHQSREWMETHGYKRFHDTPWPPVGELPE